MTKPDNGDLMLPDDRADQLEQANQLVVKYAKALLAREAVDPRHPTNEEAARACSILVKTLIPGIPGEKLPFILAKANAITLEVLGPSVKLDIAQ